MTIDPDQAPLDSDDELRGSTPAQMLRRRLVWNLVLLALLVGTVLALSVGGGWFG